VRIRSTKPEFWRSRTVASVDWDARLVLKGLESYVDDNGVGKDDVELIVSDLFPRDLAREGSRVLARVSEAIGSLLQAGLVWRYEVDGQPLLYVSSWDSIQRVDKPQAGRFPRPDGTMNYKESVIRESVASPREPSRALAPGTGEQGNRGTGEKDSSSPAPRATARAFDAFWEHYPRKVGKDAARRAFDKAARRVGAEPVILGAKRFAADPNLPEKQFIPHPATWLGRGGWEDEPLPPRDAATGAAALGRRPVIDQWRTR
jgi:hypothetical protein